MRYVLVMHCCEQQIVCFFSQALLAGGAYCTAEYYSHSKTNHHDSTPQAKETTKKTVTRLEFCITKAFFTQNEVSINNIFKPTLWPDGKSTWQTLAHSYTVYPAKVLKWKEFQQNCSVLDWKRRQSHSTSVLRCQKKNKSSSSDEELLV